MINSRYPLVCATHSGSGRRPFTLIGSSFFRSYGGNLPSSLTIVLPIALVFSTRPPVSVWGTGAVPAHCWAFLGSVGLVTSPKRLGITSRTYGPTFIGPSYSLTRRQPSLRFTYPPASSISYPPPTTWIRPKAASISTILDLTRTRRYWNINQLCIDYAFRPRLSSRLTLGG